VAFDRNVLADVYARVEALVRRSRTLLIGIDGPGGSGKSTLARELAGLLDDATIIEFDDFYRSADERRLRSRGDADEIGGDFDWPRVLGQVLNPLAVNEAARYQRYDWDRDQLAEWHVVAPGGVVIVEGNYSTRDELRVYYDLTIWVDAPYDVRLRRGVERDGEVSRARWVNEWMPQEERYIVACRPAEHVDIVIDGGAASTGWTAEGAQPGMKANT
jgi:uridine kinase